MWEVNRHTTVLFGGARALLLHAAHPLVAAGARQTGGYRRDPWARLLRTLTMQNLVTFGGEREAREAADRINKLHRVIHGTDPVTGKRYDALDPELLLWVHAALEVSTVMFYELTVQPLSEADKDRYHAENRLAAELLLTPPAVIPPTYAATVRYVDDVVNGPDLLITDVAREVGDLIRTGPVPAHIKPIWKLIAFAAVGTLPERLREMYGFDWGPVRARWLDANLAMVRRANPFLPGRYRYIMPAREAARRLERSGAPADG